MKKSLRVYFIRHGDTYFNYLKILQGWSDTPLTNKGHEEAFEVGKLLPKLGDISHNIYCSDMNRAVQTVSELNNGLSTLGHDQLNMISMPELREQFYGGFEGSPKDSTYRKIEGKSLEDTLKDFSPNELQDHFAKMDTSGLAETSQQFWTRFTSGIESIVFKEDKPTIVVTHSAILTALVGTYAPEKLSSYESDNLSLTTVEFTDYGFNPRVIAYNQHLLTEERI